MAAVPIQHISIPIFQKDVYSLDYDNSSQGYQWNELMWPTLEHLFWAMMVPSLGVLPSHPITYVRRKIRQKQANAIAIQMWSDVTQREERMKLFASYWKQQIQTDPVAFEKIVSYSNMETIP